ncbi:hypothetical protein [Pararhizobium polonicum]|nr:hypothetical protein [Pararhizobium polonicum]
MSRLFAKIAKDELALGVWIKGGPHLVTTLARAGFDFVRPDMMFSALDWKELDHVYRTAESVGMATWLRIPSNLWLGGETALQVTVDATRIQPRRSGRSRFGGLGGSGAGAGRCS